MRARRGSWNCAICRQSTPLPSSPARPHTPTVFRDTLSKIAADLGGKIQTTHGSLYDVIIRGRILTISNALASQSQDIEATVVVSPRTPGGASITQQLLFTNNSGPKDWNVPQTVTVLGIDDNFVDGGDALVFPAFEERVNAIRGPLTLEGGLKVGEERFLNDPFRLPGETNDPLPDGTISAQTTNLDGNAVLTDPEAFHFNALTGERPGFDPRMNDFLFSFTFLDGPAEGILLDVAGDGRSVSNEISLGR